MKSILVFFFMVFASLGAGVYFYETQIASPKAADALVKSKKKAPRNKIVEKKTAKAEPRIKKSSLTVTKVKDTIAKPSRVVDLAVLDKVTGKASTEQVKKQREIERSINNTIRKSISLEIQKAVATEVSKIR